MIKKLFFTAVFFSLISVFCKNSGSTDTSQGPLFIQLHYTSMVSNLPSARLSDILNGKITDFKEIDGTNRKFEAYCDSNIHEKIKSVYPNFKCVPESFRENFKLAEKKSFIGISDARGLMPHFKAVYIDGVLPWGKLEEDYSLAKGSKYPFTINGVQEWKDEAAIIVVQTGVTAMTRGFMGTMNRVKDLSYPIKYTRNITSQADLATTSNEVSFYDQCRLPLKDGLTFCTPKSYFQILVDSGFDVIELTGNHNNDYGTKYSIDSIELITSAGMHYFGGGKNQADAEKILYLTVKGVRFAFIGFNQWGPKMAWAAKNGPGAAMLSREKMMESVKEASKNSDIVFLSVQWGNENEPKPHAAQKDYFREAANLGATILVSSSAHRIMGLEFRNGKFISYGLGNFLFDQMHSIHYRRGAMARHHFYMGRHVQTELIPYMIYDFAQPRLLYGKEALSLYEEIFRYSLGSVFN